MKTYCIILISIILLSCTKQQETTLITYTGNIDTVKIITTSINPKKVDGNVIITINYESEKIFTFLNEIQEVSHNLVINTSLDLNTGSFLNNLESVGDTLSIDLRNSPTISLDFLHNLRYVSTIKIINGDNLKDYCSINSILQELPEKNIIFNNKYNPSYEQIINGICSYNMPPLPPANLNGSIPVFSK